MATSFPAPKKHEAKNFSHLIGKIPGLSEKQLKAHFGLYEGYVKKVNEIEEKLARVDRSSPNYSYNEYSELMRRHAVPFNGAYLHQMYFENLTGDRTEPQDALRAQIERDFGSFENWWADAKAGLLSGVGWVLLTRSRLSSSGDGRLYNVMLEEHHRGLFCEQDILLALDGWEHAYMIDYGTSKADYLKALESAIDWRAANQRFERAMRTASFADTEAA
jgi:Fe-Mn family superoxide dismutase